MSVLVVVPEVLRAHLARFSWLGAATVVACAPGPTLGAGASGPPAREVAPVAPPATAAGTPTFPGAAAVAPPPAPSGAASAVADSPPGMPAWSDDFASLDAWERVERAGTATSRPEPAALDGWVAELRLAGDPALTAGDRVGPVRFPVELRSRSPVHYGNYRMRVAFARCLPSETAVSGLYTYFNDGEDHDRDGLVDNAEIDIEVLCGEPYLYWMTVWTEYQASATGPRFRKRTRRLDVRDGSCRETPPGRQDTWDLVPCPGFGASLAALADGARFHDVGFEWTPERVRYFAEIDGAELTLFTLDDAGAVPVLPGAWRVNLWHSRRHWWKGGEADYPARDALLRLDRFEYTPLGGDG